MQHDVCKHINKNVFFKQSKNQVQQEPFQTTMSLLKNCNKAKCADIYNLCQI